MSYFLTLIFGIWLGREIFGPRARKRRDSWLTKLSDTNARAFEIDSGKLVRGLYRKRVEIEEGVQ